MNQTTSAKAATSRPAMAMPEALKIFHAIDGCVGFPRVGVATGRKALLAENEAWQYQHLKAACEGSSAEQLEQNGMRRIEVVGRERAVVARPVIGAVPPSADQSLFGGI